MLPEAHIWCNRVDGCVQASASAAALRLRETVFQQREGHLCRQVAQLEGALSQAKLMLGRSPLPSHSQLPDRYTGQSSVLANVANEAAGMAMDSQSGAEADDDGITVVQPSSLMLRPRRTTDSRCV